MTTIRFLLRSDAITIDVNDAVFGEIGRHTSVGAAGENEKYFFRALGDEGFAMFP